LCFGNSTGAADLTVTGVTSTLSYSWTGPNGFTATTEDLSGLAAGTYNVTITDANGCSTTASVTITQPAAGLTASIAGTDVLCFGDATGAANLTVSGGTAPYTYSWSNNATTEDLSNLAAGTYNVTITDANGCTTTASVTITEPAAGLSASATTTGFDCITNSAQIIVSAQGGVGPYVGTGSFFVNAQGTYTYDVYDANGCYSQAVITVTAGTPLLASSIQGLDVLCDSVMVGYVKYQVDTTSTLTGYTWSLPQGMMIVSGQGTHRIFVEIDYSFTNGYVSVIGHSPCGDTQPDSMYVDLVPQTPEFTVAPACGYVGLDDIFTVSGSQGVDFIWTPPYGAVILNGQGTSTVELKYSQSFTSGYLEVYAENACGASAIEQVFVNAVPDVPSQIYGNTSICSSQLETFWVDSASRADYYIWGMPTGATIVGNQTNDTIQVQFSNFISGSITVMAANNCGSTAMKSISVTAQSISPATAIFGPTNACIYIGGNSVNYSTPVVSGVTAYNWQVPAGASILSGQGTSSIWVEFAQGFTGGSIGVSLADGCAVSSLTSLNIISSQSSTAGNISGPVDVCDFTSGLSATYTIPQVSGANSYNWQAPAGCTITNNGSNTVQIAYPNGFIMGTISVTVSFNCGPDAVRTLDVSSQPQNAFIVGPVCITPGQSYTYTINGGLGASNFNWVMSGQGTILSGQGTNSVVVSYSAVFDTGTLSVTPSCNCGNGQTSDLVVKVSAKIPNSIFGPSNLCVGDTVMYSIDDYTDVNYLIWSLPTGLQAINSMTADTIVVAVGSSFVGGSISVMRVNDCGSSPMKYKSLFGCQLAMANSTKGDNAEELRLNQISAVDTATNNFITERTLIIFPNPASSDFQFFIGGAPNDVYNVNIRSNVGQVVYSAEHKQRELINIQQLSKGLHYVTVTNSLGYSVTTTLIKQ
jgi:hypothetical protein